METLHAGLAAYLEANLPPADDVRAAMEAHAHERNFPMVGPHVGTLLELLARMQGAKRIFELGSGFGYSAWWFARGLAEGGHIQCTDFKEQNIAKAEEFLTRAGVWDKVTYHQGSALAAFEPVTELQDIVFCDIDKHDYPQAFAMAMERLRPGGLLLTDNTIWHGNILDEERQDADTVAVREYNRLCFQSPHVRSFLVPVRDGLMVTLKLSDASA